MGGGTRAGGQDGGRMGGCAHRGRFRGASPALLTSCGSRFSALALTSSSLGYVRSGAGRGSRGGVISDVPLAPAGVASASARVELERVATETTSRAAVRRRGGVEGAWASRSAAAHL